VNPTIQTYDDMAAEFAQKTWNIRLERALDSFARYLIPAARVLDLGCGPGRDIELLRARGARVVGADLSLGMLREARARVGGTLVCGDMCALPCASASFDGVWLCAALLHLPREDAPRALAEVRRILHATRPLYVAVQQGEGERWVETRGARLFVYYQPDELAAIVRAAGFDVQESWVNQDETRTQIKWINLVALAE
jgi:ubiquinone/menaquinone biosynthesis C-methylase UbiE